ncbi:hypothetical protein U1Q18_006511 [Sarracenia purpurea var. burkii]
MSFVVVSKRGPSESSIGEAGREAAEEEEYDDGVLRRFGSHGREFKRRNPEVGIVAMVCCHCIESAAKWDLCFLRIDNRRCFRQFDDNGCQFCNFSRFSGVS